MNIAQNLERSARHFPDKPAIVCGERTVTYRELEAAVGRTAHGLAAMGVAEGDRVALFLPNIPEFPIAYLAAQKVGAVAVSVNVMLTTGELRYILQDSGASVLFTTAALWPQVRPLAGELPSLQHVVICEGEVERLPNLAAIGAGQPEVFKARDLDRAAPAAILYTSGTTGKQKGAVLSHGNVVSNMYATVHALRVDPADRLLLFLPLFHCFGQNFIMNAGLQAGATLVMHRRFDLGECLDSVERNGVTIFYAVPAIYIQILNAGTDPRRLAGVRHYFSAAATMPLEIANRWRDAYGRVIHEGYGLTETSPFASYNHEYAHRPGSIGTPIEMVEMKVVDADGQEVAPGTWGEIVIKGPNVMLGYWNRPAETAEAMRGGWFHSGDVGYVDDDGYFYIVDRVKDMINSAGFKIWPREVEEVLYRHPAIKECAVVGAPDPVKGEVPKAYVVLHPSAELTADALDAYCRERLAAYKVPRRIEFTREIPKNATGKILKRVLRERAAEQGPAPSKLP